MVKKCCQNWGVHKNIKKGEGMLSIEDGLNPLQTMVLCHSTDAVYSPELM